MRGSLCLLLVAGALAADTANEQECEVCGMLVWRLESVLSQKKDDTAPVSSTDAPATASTTATSDGSAASSPSAGAQAASRRSQARRV